MPAKVEHWANHREPVASGQGRERHRGSSDRRIGPHAISLRLWRGGVSVASAAAPGAAETYAQREEVRRHHQATELNGIKNERYIRAISHGFCNRCHERIGTIDHIRGYDQDGRELQNYGELRC